MKWNRRAELQGCILLLLPGCKVSLEPTGNVALALVGFLQPPFPHFQPRLENSLGSTVSELALGKIPLCCLLKPLIKSQSKNISQPQEQELPVS